MDDRERREFNAGLSEEVDAWLRGDTSRREFLTRLMLMGGAAMLPGLGYTASGSKAWAAAADVSKVELADKSTPLGAGSGRRRESVDRRADRRLGLSRGPGGAEVQGQGRHPQSHLRGRSAGAGAEELLGPLWQALTGINFNVVELPHPDQYSKPIAEHIANSGAYDVLDIEPAWIPALANGGVIMPIDDYVAKYMNKADLDDYHPLYKSITLYKGKRWGVFDDGDQFALYYRTDVFGDPKLKDAYQAKFGKPFGVPKTWDEYSQVAQFITDQLAPNVYGAGAFPQVRQPGQPVRVPAAVPRQRRQVLRRGHEGAARRPGGRDDAHPDDRPEQGVDPRQQRPRRRRAMGGLAAGQGGDDLLLAADRPHVLQLRPARQGDQFHSRVQHRRQGRLRGRARRQRRDGVRLRQGAGRRLEQRGGGLSLHAMGHRAAAVAGAHDAALHAARSLSPLDLQVGRISGAVAGRQRLPHQLVRLRQLGRRRHDHARLAGLRAVHRPHVHRGLGRRGPEGRAARRRRPNGTRPPSGSAYRAQKAAYQEFLKIPGCYADHTIEKLGQAVHIT